MNRTRAAVSRVDLLKPRWVRPPRPDRGGLGANTSRAVEDSAKWTMCVSHGWFLHKELSFLCLTSVRDSSSLRTNCLRPVLVASPRTGGSHATLRNGTTLREVFIQHANSVSRPCASANLACAGASAPRGSHVAAMGMRVCAAPWGKWCGRARCLIDTWERAPPLYWRGTWKIGGRHAVIPSEIRCEDARLALVIPLRCSQQARSL